MRSLFFPTRAVAFVCTLGSLTIALGSDPFPLIAPEEVGISSEAIEELSDHVQSLIESEAVVGGEIHVIKGRKTILRRAYGWADREAGRNLETNAVYCVRSMTKPLVGTAIQILLDEKQLKLDHRVSQFLSSFDTPSLREITIENLLTHTSGLKFTSIQKPLSEYRSLADVAQEAAETGVDFKAGTSFQYSDSGSDTLGAIVSVVSGLSPEDFLRDRILKPLSMRDSITLLGEATKRNRIPTAYSGGLGNWQPHWKNTDHPIFPIFLTSQSLYCTTTDYARFMTLWMDRGKYEERRLVSQEAVDRALRPGWPIRGYPTGFADLSLSYGQQWMVYHKKDSARIVAFGHNGSDGTHAWAWPEHDLIVLFFTQSRGTMAGVELEGTLERLLIQRDVQGYRRDRLAMQTAQQSLEPYQGIYWDEDVEDAYYVMVVENNKLVMERPGRLRAVAKPKSGKGKFQVGNSLQLEFESGANPAPAMLMTTTTRTERQVRHQRRENLPALDEVAKRVAEAHGISNLPDAGVIKRTGTIRMGMFGTKGKITHWFDHRNSRTEVQLGRRTAVVVTNGDEVAASGLSGSLERFEGPAREQEVLGHPAIEYGHWRRGYEQLEVMKYIEGKKQLIVRAVPSILPGATLYVDTETHRVHGAQRIQFAPGLGYVGVRTRYGDFRDVAGVTLPFKIETEHANRLLGKVVVNFEAGESQPRDDDLFKLPDD